ncbi:MAG: hypothetical protein EPN14_08655 [Gallionella sp.]|nr:MAG: hypothetical protein EPN14_08655 [Gallionella sp.]
MSSSDDTKPGADAGAEGVVERRRNNNLRVVFETSCRITAPFFDPAHGWGNASLTMYARQTLREAHPDLTQQEIAILFSAVERFHKTGRDK